METAAPTIRALELENQRLRADVAELVAALKQSTLLLEIGLQNRRKDWDGSAHPGSAIGVGRALIKKHGA